MDWEAVRNAFVQLLQEYLEDLDREGEDLTRRLIRKIREKGFFVTEEEERELEGWLKEREESLGRLMSEVAQGVSLAVGVSGKGFAEEVLGEALRIRYSDGLTLSERLWRLREETKLGLRDRLLLALKKGEGADRIARELQEALDEDVALRKPKWLEELEEMAKGFLRGDRDVREWKSLLREVEKKIERLSREGSRARRRRLLRELENALERSKEVLIEKAVRNFLKGEQIARLKGIAQTEGANVFHIAQIRATEGDPDVVGYRWKLSRSHPAPDVCDVLATVDYGLGKGVHPKDRVPRQKPHPYCMCYLIPVMRRGRRRGRKRGELDREVLRKIAPQYVRDLSALGVDIERLWDRELNAFVRRKDLAERIGEEEFKILQTVGRTARAGRWKSAKPKDIERELVKLRTAYGGSVPDEAMKVLGRRSISSLDLHYLKRKYLDGWDLESPEALNRMFTEHIKNPEVQIYRQGDRYALEFGRYVAIIHPPDTRITIFELDEQYEDYEDYAKQTGRPIIRLWQLKRILSRLL